MPGTLISRLYLKCTLCCLKRPSTEENLDHEQSEGPAMDLQGESGGSGLEWSISEREKKDVYSRGVGDRKMIVFTWRGTACLKGRVLG